MHASRFLIAIDLLSFAFAFGTTAWFFFIQSPVLLKTLGRDRFVPIQMRLTVILFRALTASLFIMLAASAAHSSLTSPVTIAAAAALAAVLINTFVVLPKALRAGGQGRAEVKGRDVEGSTSNFVSAGVGARTKVLHRLVVLFVVAMLLGTGIHGLRLFAV